MKGVVRPCVWRKKISARRFSWSCAARHAAQARMSAVGEGLERYSAIWQGYEYVIWASYTELKAQALHPNVLLGFSARQYATRTAWNAACASSMLDVPEPFDEEEGLRL